MPNGTRYTQRAKEYVQKNIYSTITQKSVSDYLSITPEYLCSVFKKVEGTTFKRYVNNGKLEMIKMLIEKEHLHLYEAAAQLGYSDPNYVSRLFKQYYGYNVTKKKKLWK